MKKRIFAAVMLMLMVITCTYSCFAVNADNAVDNTLGIKSADYNHEDSTLTFVIANYSDKTVLNAAVILTEFNESEIIFENFNHAFGGEGIGYV